MSITATDERYMAAAIRLARRHEGWTGTNPSVACLIVADRGGEPVITGSAITAIGGRPHAEPIALAEAGETARGATAYVTLEPCAHHGRTPPCAHTLIDAGIARVVTAVVDPDERVSGKGHAMLTAAGIEVVSGVLANEAADGLSPYLLHKTLGRPLVTLKLAVSADGFLGLRGEGQIAITGPLARARSHLMRARHHAILIGAATARADDPQLTCRLPGLEGHSPIRIVLDPAAGLSLDGALATSAREVPLWVTAPPDLAADRRAAMLAAGIRPLGCELHEGRVALPELMEDLGAQGIQSLMVEGGAAVAHSFLEEGLVDEIVLFESPVELAGRGGEPVASPVAAASMPQGFAATERLELGDDTMTRYKRAITRASA